MINVIGVRFRSPGKVYFFDPAGFDVKLGDRVIVETAMGKELGTVEIVNRELDEAKLKDTIKKVVKIADKKDIEHQKQNVKEQNKALDMCRKKVKEHKLEMDIIEARYLFDNSKLIFYFLADGRIDFRDLVKDLAASFKTRIELRQISIRDQVKRIGGLGPCGRELCCTSFLNGFESVSIKMAKEQNLSLNAEKITGQCGRLMCCLKYEQNVYEDKMKTLPHVGAIVETEEGRGTVDSVEVLREILRVKLKDEEGVNYFRRYNVSDVKVIKDKKDDKDSIKSEEETAEIKELEKLEKIDKKEISNSSDDE